MSKSLMSLLVDPKSANELEYSSLGQGNDGCLVNPDSKACFPVFDGVPVFLPKPFTAEFVRQHAKALEGLELAEYCSANIGGTPDWSFSREWDEHFETDTDRTWGYTVQERFEQFLMECQISLGDLQSMRILDAGCGNGTMTDLIGEYCADITGIDFSSGVQHAEKRKTAENSLYIQGDLLAPPLGQESFDLIYSIGVLHHTPDTRKAFDAVAKLTKPGGKLYVWLYRKPENFLGRMVKVPIYDSLRWITSRLPPKAQDVIVHSYARLVHGLHGLRKGGAPVPLREYVVSAYDDLTCRWRYYHHPCEVARWFHEAGYSAPVLSHWDNPYGFGMLAEKRPQEHTPGISYGDGVKLWDPEQTLLGRLHKD